MPSKSGKPVKDADSKRQWEGAVLGIIIGIILATAFSLIDSTNATLICGVLPIEVIESTLVLIIGFLVSGFVAGYMAKGVKLGAVVGLIIGIASWLPIMLVAPTYNCPLIINMPTYTPIVAALQYMFEALSNAIVSSAIICCIGGLVGGYAASRKRKAIRAARSKRRTYGRKGSAHR